MRIFREEQIINCITGATLMASGGGGSLKNGLDMLDKYKKDHPGAKIEIKVIKPEEMNPGAYAAVTCGMGAPMALKKVDFSKYATNAYMCLKDMAALMTPPRNIEYSLSVELGGFSTFIPMLISLLNDVPMVDADGAGRAVPALDTLLLNVNGCDTSPLAMANGDNDKVEIFLNDPKNAPLGELIGRNICGAFGNMSGLSGWMVSQKEINDRIITDSIDLSERVGQCIKYCTDNKVEVFANLKERGIVDATYLGRGKITDKKVETSQGFDFGYTTIETEKGKYQIKFQNENLVIYLNGKAYMTCPDIIMMYDAKTYLPLTNADNNIGMDVVLGKIKIDDKWKKNSKFFDYWRKYLKIAGYTGEYIPY